MPLVEELSITSFVDEPEIAMKRAAKWHKSQLCKTAVQVLVFFEMLCYNDEKSTSKAD